MAMTTFWLSESYRVHLDAEKEKITLGQKK